MSTRHVYSIIMGMVCIASIGCCGCLRNACSGSYGGQVYSDCATCGCPEASCCCPDAACGCPEASCCCPDVCSGCPGEVCCGSPVVGVCPLLQRIRNAFWGCSGCGCETYYGDSTSCPSCYGNEVGNYQSPSVSRRPSLAGRRKLDEALRFAEEDQPTYR